MFHKIMEFKLKGADTYYNHGSTWIILTEKKQWVLELTKDGTLWYNYYFFESILCGMMGFEDTVKNQNYITEWVENFIRNGVKHTDGCQIGTSTSIEDAIQNGVKDTRWLEVGKTLDVEDTIENGVKNTQAGNGFIDFEVEDTIQNGVQGTTPGGYLGSVEMKGNIVHQFEHAKQNDDVENTIQNGVKETKHNLWDAGLAMEEAIQNGVKETYGQKHKPLLLGDVIQNGVKETQWRKVDNHPTYVDRIIVNQ